MKRHGEVESREHGSAHTGSLELEGGSLELSYDNHQTWSRQTQG
jgi:hypothetical protein